jgi:site-specific recombinase XerD
VGTADVKKSIEARLDAGAAAATVNRELAALKRVFSIAIENERLTRPPTSRS